MKIKPCIISAVFLLSAALTPVRAQEPEANSQPEAHALEPADVEAFLDRAMEVVLMDSNKIAGATIAVVANGETIFAKGYGLADVENEKKVVASETLFRIGSVSKLFVWTAVMQLVEQGRLDLHADVNTYFTDFQVPEAFGQPITMFHLMTHTAGFESAWGYHVRDVGDLAPLNENLVRLRSERVRPPGEISSYTNYAAALAAHVVECISGKSWADYLEQSILFPLDMSHTTVRQPVPARDEGNLSKGYKYIEGEYTEDPSPFYRLAPAAAMTSTATDMAHFMIAHLQNGRYGDERILSETTVTLMRSGVFLPAPGLRTLPYGLQVLSRKTLRVIGHSGEVPPFLSFLALLPEHDVGLFVSFNGVTSPGNPRKSLLIAFLKRYFPAEDLPRLKQSADLDPSTFLRVAGSYRTTFRSYTTPAKIRAIDDAITIRVDNDDALLFDDGVVSRWIQVDSLLFSKEDAERRLAFREDEKGRITHMIVDGDEDIFSSYTTSYERISWYETRKFHLSTLAFALFFFAAMLLAPLVVPVIRRVIRRLSGSGNKATLKKPFKRVSRIPIFLSWTTALVFILFFSTFFPALNRLRYEISPSVQRLLFLPIVGGILTIGVLVCAVFIWKNRFGRLSGRVFYTLFAVACVTFLWELNYWNMLGFKY